MTDITELAQSEINDALAQLKQISEYPTPSTQYARVLRKYILALVEALELKEEQRANWSQMAQKLGEDLDAAEKRIAELEPFHTAYMEWSDKTAWVQTDKRFDVLKPWGKHRADVLKEYIQHMESRTVTVKQGEVLVTVAGFTGCGKSAIAGEIEIAMKAIGLPVTWANGDSEKRMTGADWLTAIEMYKPSVRIVEVNIPRAAGIKVEAE